MSSSKMLLYSYFRSSCSARVRIAAHLKNINLEYSYIHLVKGEQQDAKYKEINPGGTVPTLIYNDSQGKSHRITQSIAILEFLEEQFPELPKLLPPLSDTVARANVRVLVNLVNADIQPVTNLRMLKRVRALGGDATTYAAELNVEGFEAYERLAQQWAGTYSVGDNVTLADVVLAPAVEGALRNGVDMEKFPTVKRIFDTIKVLDAFRQGDWRHQPDTPDEFRVDP